MINVYNIIMIFINIFKNDEKNILNHSLKCSSSKHGKFLYKYKNEVIFIFIFKKRIKIFIKYN